MELTNETTFNELIATEECGDDDVLSRMAGDPVVMNAVLDSIEEDVNSRLVKRVQYGTFTPEYLKVLRRISRIGLHLVRVMSDEVLSSYGDEE